MNWIGWAILAIVLLWLAKHFSFNAGRKFGYQIADLIGIERRLFSSALLEVGITWNHLKVMKNSGTSVVEAANLLIPDLVQGLAIVRQKFGEQPLISAAERAVESFQDQ